MSTLSFHAKTQMVSLDLQNLLQERNQALERVSELGRQYNSKLPISTLPIELLLKIFRFHPSPHPGFGDPSWFMRSVSQVCHHWRKAALGAPFLWGPLIDCQRLPPKWLRVVLRRARSSPLHVSVVPSDDMDGSTNFSDPNVHLALRELAQIRELGICCSMQEGIIRPMIKHFQQPASSLRSFTLEVINSENPDIDVQLLPANIFSGTTGPLQHLNLINCLIDLDSSLYQHLTSLSIMRVPEIIAPSTSRWLEMLRNAPNLTSLSLLNSAFSPSAIAGRVQNVHLPQLSKLHISGPFLQCSKLMSHLRYPVLHTFDLQLLDLDLENATIRTLSSLINNQLSKIDPIRLFSVILSDGYIRFLNDYATFSSPQTRETERTHFSISCLLEPSVQPPDVPRLLSLLMNDIAPRVSHCEKLTLGFWPKEGLSIVESIKSFTRAFSSVTTLDLHGTRLDEFFDCLSTPDSEQPANATDDNCMPSTCVLLPDLQYLILNIAHISPALITFLAYRNKCRRAIKSIQLPDRFEDFASLQAIRSLCSSVTIDCFVIPHAPFVRSERLEKEYFDYEGEEATDLEIEVIAG